MTKEEAYRAVIEDLAKEVTRLKKLASYQDFEIEKLQNKIPKSIVLLMYFSSINCLKE